MHSTLKGAETRIRPVSRHVNADAPRAWVERLSSNADHPSPMPATREGRRFRPVRPNDTGAGRSCVTRRNRVAWIRRAVSSKGDGEPDASSRAVLALDTTPGADRSGRAHPASPALAAGLGYRRPGPGQDGAGDRGGRDHHPGDLRP